MAADSMGINKISQEVMYREGERPKWEPRSTLVHKDGQRLRRNSKRGRKKTQSLKIQGRNDFLFY